MVFDIKDPVTTGKLLDTPSLPRGAKKVELTENAHQVFMKRYARRGADGQPNETVEETFWVNSTFLSFNAASGILSVG